MEFQARNKIAHDAPGRADKRGSASATPAPSLCTYVDVHIIREETDSELNLGPAEDP